MLCSATDFLLRHEKIPFYQLLPNLHPKPRQVTSAPFYHALQVGYWLKPYHRFITKIWLETSTQIRSLYEGNDSELLLKGYAATKINKIRRTTLVLLEEWEGWSSQAVCYHVILHYPQAFRWIPHHHQSQSLIRMALGLHGSNLQFVSCQSKTQQNCTIAVQQCSPAFEYIPGKILTADFLMTLFQENPQLLKNIRFRKTYQKYLSGKPIMILCCCCNSL